MKKNNRKDKQEGGVRVPIPRPGGPMKDKKKYNRKKEQRPLTDAEFLKILYDGDIV